jgi:hypothetical protein
MPDDLLAYIPRNPDIGNARAEFERNRLPERIRSRALNGRAAPRRLQNFKGAEKAIFNAASTKRVNPLAGSPASST